MGLKFNPPPGWPPPPAGFMPAPGWQPDPDWPPAPEGWQFFEANDEVHDQADDRVHDQADDEADDQADDATQATDPGSLPAWSGQPADPGDYHPAYYQGPVKTGTNAFAVASVVLGILGFLLITAVLSLIFGIVALSQVRTTRQRGNRLAIAGVTLSGGWLCAMVGATILAATLGAFSRASPAGSSRGPASVSVFSLRAGDCLNDPGAQTGVLRISTKPCSQPHSAQVFAQFGMAPGTRYPGAAAIRHRASTGCYARRSVLDTAKLTSAMSIRFLYPEATSWVLGHRTITCLIVAPKPDITSSLLNG